MTEIYMQQQLCFLLEKLQNFGLFMLSTREAAQISIVDMCYSRYPLFEIDRQAVLKVLEGRFSTLFWRNNDLLNILNNDIEKFLKKIIHAIELKRLDTANIMRTKDDKIDPDKTYIHYNNLTSWLESFGYICGETFDEFKLREKDIQFFICEEIEHIRIAERYNNVQVILDSYSQYWNEGDAINQTDLYSRWKAAVLENNRLDEELTMKHNNEDKSGNNNDIPLSERNRRTFLTIFAALCQKAKINPNDRGTAGRIMQATEELGARISEDTIRLILKDIPTAVESRLK